MAGNQVNVEYFFRLLYDLIYGPHGYVHYDAFRALLAQIWFWVVIVGYLLALIGLFIIIYVMTRLAELRKREKEFYGTLLLAPDAESGGHPRWSRIQELAQGTSQSEWREAIIESDILLDELLTDNGYQGESVAERLNNAERSLSTSKNAWEAHRVRNQIAHEGSTFTIDESLVRRTIANYEAVFREMNAI